MPDSSFKVGDKVRLKDQTMFGSVWTGPMDYIGNYDTGHAKCIHPVRREGGFLHSHLELVPDERTDEDVVKSYRACDDEIRVIREKKKALMAEMKSRGWSFAAETGKFYKTARVEL